MTAGSQGKPDRHKKEMLFFVRETDNNLLELDCANKRDRQTLQVWTDAGRLTGTPVNKVVCQDAGELLCELTCGLKVTPAFCFY